MQSLRCVNSKMFISAFVAPQIGFELRVHYPVAIYATRPEILSVLISGIACNGIKIHPRDYSSGFLMVALVDHRHFLFFAGGKFLSEKSIASSFPCPTK